MDNLRRIRTLAAEYDLEYHVGTTGDIGLRRANLILQGYNGILFYADVSSIRRGARRITSRGFEIRFPSRHSRRRGKAFVLVVGNTASRSLSGTQVVSCVYNIAMGSYLVLTFFRNDNDTLY